MATGTATGRGVVFRVLDALDAPHSGRILRLRLQAGEAPSVRTLRGALRTRVAVSTDATHHAEVEMRAAGFDEFWPKPSGVEFMRQRLAELLRQA